MRRILVDSARRQRAAKRGLGAAHDVLEDPLQGIDLGFA
ncbi:MAG: ECF-type sigma factor [Verrucomicrobiales bacterium]